MIIIYPPPVFLTSLAPPESNSLPVLLQLRDQSISLLYNIGVLLVFVIGSVGFDDAIYPVNCTGYAVGRYEFGKVPKEALYQHTRYRRGGTWSESPKLRGFGDWDRRTYPRSRQILQSL